MVTTCGRDLGATLDHKMTMRQQCDAAANNANTMFACISRTIASKSGEVVVYTKSRKINAQDDLVKEKNVQKFFWSKK